MQIQQYSSKLNLPAIKTPTRQTNNMHFGMNALINRSGFDTVSFSSNEVQAPQVNTAQHQPRIVSPQEIRNAVLKQDKPLISVKDVNAGLGTNKIVAVCNPGMYHDEESGITTLFLRCIEKADESFDMNYPEGNFLSRTAVVKLKDDGKTVDKDSYQTVINPIPPFGAGFEDVRATEDPNEKGLIHIICTGYTGNGGSFPEKPYFRACHFTTTNPHDPSTYIYHGTVGPENNKDCALLPVPKGNDLVFVDRPLHKIDPNDCTKSESGSMACTCFSNWSDLNDKFWTKEMKQERIAERAMIPCGTGWLSKTGLGVVPPIVKRIVQGKEHTYLVHWFHSSGTEPGENVKKYYMGLALSDINDPTKIIHLAPHWIAQPDRVFEAEGDDDNPTPVKNVMFPGGAFVTKNEAGEDIFVIFYGAGDGGVGRLEVPVDGSMDFAVQYDALGNAIVDGAIPGTPVKPLACAAPSAAAA